MFLKNKYNQVKTGKSKAVHQTVFEKIKIKRKGFKTYKEYKTKENYQYYNQAGNEVKVLLLLSTGI